MLTVGTAMAKLGKELGFDYVFKASFDKANRTSSGSARGPGLATATQWFGDIKQKLGVPVLTDVHETIQVKPVAEVCDVLQIPAFLCRQTDLVVAAAESGRQMNIKKGQFMAPGAMAHIVKKARAATGAEQDLNRVWLTERGATFGYGNLVVDMRAFPIMAASQAPLLLDITHSTQLPAGGEGGTTSSGERRFAPVLARAATATGHLAGYFLEVHTDPAKAISDKDAQLSIAQATTLLKQLIPFWRESQSFSAIDKEFV
jgi:2-dehydro-3-deoxyphosphooctonate aldolase (KDO 8-P synthase)